jgi:hypothetical protein
MLARYLYYLLANQAEEVFLFLITKGNYEQN